MKFISLLPAALLAIVSVAPKAFGEAHKISDGVVYQDTNFHCAFPSVVRLPSGELIMAFRRAPDWRLYGATAKSHTDPNSQLMLVRSRDDGVTWSKTPQLIFAHPYGGSQDPCMVLMDNGSILLASYGWSETRNDVFDKLPQPLAVNNGGQGRFVSLGGYQLRSDDEGRTWQGPMVPPPADGEHYHNTFGHLQPAQNRGAIYQGKNGTLYWSVAFGWDPVKGHSADRLMTSTDHGMTWNQGPMVASSDQCTFNETSMYETPKGDLVAFLRTEDFDDQACISRSTDGGRSFKWGKAGFQGHPLQATRLPDNRVLLVYGYRHPPYGIRARILNAECTDTATAKEIVLRADGGNVDLGYPWSVVLNKDRALVVYYFNVADGIRFIGSTLLALH